LTGHVLTGLITLTTLECFSVIYRLIEEGLLELLGAIIVQDRMIILNILYLKWGTVVGSLGLPLALSVFGFIKLPGG